MKIPSGMCSSSTSSEFILKVSETTEKKTKVVLKSKKFVPKEKKAKIHFYFLFDTIKVLKNQQLLI